MEKTVNVGDREVRFRASALTPRIYRERTGRDLFIDIAKLETAIKDAGQSAGTLPIEALTIFEDVAFTMAKQADSSVPDTADDWLDEFGVFDIYVVLPQIIALWRGNTATTSKPKKK